MPLYALDGVRPDLATPRSVWIAPNAHVIGDVRLEENASVWFGATLRGDNERIAIGAGTNIQENAVLHTDPGFPLTTGRDCTIGHGAIVHGCTLGDGVLIGMGATVLNGAVIGAGSLVGAGALVTEDKVFPEKSLIVGVPARAKRELDDEALEHQRETARRYAARAHHFASALVEVSAG